MSNNDIDLKIELIFAKDVVGYIKHMSKEEDGILFIIN